MNFESARKLLGPLSAERGAPALEARKRRLRNAARRGELGLGERAAGVNCRPAAGCSGRAALSSAMMRIAVGVAWLAFAMLGCSGDTGPGGRVGRPAPQTTAKSAASQVCGPSPDASIGGCGPAAPISCASTRRALAWVVRPTTRRRRSARTAGLRPAVALGLATTSVARRNMYSPAGGVNRTPRRGIPPPRAAL